jgi:hypothetical protein
MIELNIATIDIEVIPEPIVIEINNNPIAIKGDKGEGGLGVFSETFTISTPSNEWIVNHNRGYIPSVIVMNLFDRAVISEVHHVSNNQVRIYLSSEQVGKVVIN